MNLLHIACQIIFALLLVCTTGCRSSRKPAQEQQMGYPYLRCAAISDDGQEEQISLPPLVLHRKGKDLTITGIEETIVRVGLLAGLHEATPQTIQNMTWYLEQFRTARIQALLILGGTGRTATDIEDVLSPLAGAPIPILILPGAQESFYGFRQAIRNLKQRHPQFVDLTLVRRVSMRHIRFVSLPGHGNPYYLEAKSQGCAFTDDDIRHLKKLTSGNVTNVLLSPTPPLGSGLHAVDRGINGTHIGHPGILDLLKTDHFRFGLHGYVYESGGNATATEGPTPLQSGLWHTSFALQAGRADAIPMQLTDLGRTRGMAHIVEFSGNRGRFRTLLVPTPD